MFVEDGPLNRGFLRGKYDKRSLDNIRAVVIHTTGGGIIRRWRRERARFPSHTPFDTALRVYHKLMDAGPHYVVGQEGRVAQTCPHEYAAWHVGKSQSWAYWSKNALRRSSKYDWWRERWPALQSPAELADGFLWRGGQCNPNVLGIEVVPPIADPTGRGPWSPACERSLVRLCLMLSETYNIPLSKYHFFGHSDAHPHRRTEKSRPWDPTVYQLCPAEFAGKLRAARLAVSR